MKKNSSLAWGLDSVPWSSIDFELVRQDKNLFYLLTAASFVEIAADLYSENLARHFDDDQEIVDWLQTSWGKEEVRHGETLRKYVKTVWPEFDWETAYAGFYKEYSKKCIVSSYESSQALEMVARCVPGGVAVGHDHVPGGIAAEQQPIHVRRAGARRGQHP